MVDLVTQIVRVGRPPMVAPMVQEAPPGKVVDLVEGVDELGPSAPVVTSRTSSTPDAFYVELVAMSARHGWVPISLLEIFWSESSMRPSAENTSKNRTQINAVGIGQIIPSNLPGLGWSDGPAAFAKLSALEQLPYEEKYFSTRGLPAGADAGGVYLLNLAPADASHAGDDAFVIAREDDPHTGWIYSGNEVFDSPHKGYITVGDLAKHVDSVCTGPTWDEHKARLEWAAKGSGGGGGLSSGAIAGLAVAALAATGATYLVAVARGWIDAPPWVRRLGVVRRLSRA